MKRLLIITILVLLQMTHYAEAQIPGMRNWPVAKRPEKVGLLLSRLFIASPHPNFSVQTPPKYITYPEVCTWYGALRYARAMRDTGLMQQLSERFQRLLGTESAMVPPPVHVDYNVFGIVPLELYKQLKQPACLMLGQQMADTQWQSPDTATSQAQKQLREEGYSWQTRMWIDDMYMIPALQAQAFAATGNRIYIDRAAKEMCYYLDSLQQPNGLFFHAPDVPFYWGRGNGWVAAGMSELLRVLPANSQYRKRILTGYRKMMAALLEYQDTSGLWRQLINDTGSWIETSGSGMFTFALIMGVKHGWLNGRQYGNAASKAWLALTDYLQEDGKMTEVCQGTNKKNDRQYYLDRRRITGDMHGQAPVLWCAAALLE